MTIRVFIIFYPVHSELYYIKKRKPIETLLLDCWSVFSFIITINFIS